MSGRPRAKPLSAFGERLQHAIASSDEVADRSEFLASAAVSRSQLYKYESGGTAVPLERIREFARILDCDERWLKSGDSMLTLRFQEHCGHCGEEFVMRGRHRYVCGCSIDRMEERAKLAEAELKRALDALAKIEAITRDVRQV